jgi:hypothetical protein
MVVGAVVGAATSQQTVQYNQYSQYSQQYKPIVLGIKGWL